MRRLLLALLACSLLVAGCDVSLKSGGVHPPARVFTIRVHNDAGQLFEVDLDGLYLGSVTSGSSIETEALEGFHRLEAWDSRGVLRAEREVYLESDFVWILER